MHVRLQVHVAAHSKLYFAINPRACNSWHNLLQLRACKAHLPLDAFGVRQQHVQLVGINVQDLVHDGGRQLPAVLSHPPPHPLVVVVVLGPRPAELWQGLLPLLSQQRLQRL